MRGRANRFIRRQRGVTILMKVGTDVVVLQPNGGLARQVRRRDRVSECLASGMARRCTFHEYGPRVTLMPGRGNRKQGPGRRGHGGGSASALPTGTLLSHHRRRARQRHRPRHHPRGPGRRQPRNLRLRRQGPRRSDCRPPAAHGRVNERGGVPISSVGSNSRRVPLPPPSESVGPGGRRWVTGLDAWKPPRNWPWRNIPANPRGPGPGDGGPGPGVQASLYPNPMLGTFSPQVAGNQSQYSGFVSQDLVTMGKIRLNTGAAERARPTSRGHGWCGPASMCSTNGCASDFIRRWCGRATRRDPRSHGDHRADGTLHRRAAVAGRNRATRGDVLLLQIELARSEAELRNAVTLANTTKRQLAAATGMHRSADRAGRRRPAPTAARLRGDRRAARRDRP